MTKRKNMPVEPCRILLRWYVTPVPVAGEWLVSVCTGYLILSSVPVLKADHTRVSISAMRFKLEGVPSDAVVWWFSWDGQGQRKYAQDT